MAALSANYEFAHQLISRLQRTAGLTGRTAAWRRVSQWPVWAENAITHHIRSAEGQYLVELSLQKGLNSEITSDAYIRQPVTGL